MSATSKATIKRHRQDQCLGWSKGNMRRMVQSMEAIARWGRGFKVLPPCRNGDGCHITAPRGSQTGTQGNELRLKGMIPEKLVRSISAALKESLALPAPFGIGHEGASLSLGAAPVEGGALGVVAHSEARRAVGATASQAANFLVVELGNINEHVLTKEAFAGLAVRLGATAEAHDDLTVGEHLGLDFRDSGLGSGFGGVCHEPVYTHPVDIPAYTHPSGPSGNLEAP